MIVVDVNVIAYVRLTGEQTQLARAALHRDPEWAAPVLWRSEWHNVLAGYLRRGSIDQAAALEHVREAAMLVQGRELVADDARVMELVSRSTCTACDCEYVAVAETLGVPMITADRRILRDFPSIARSLESFAG